MKSRTSCQPVLDQLHPAKPSGDYFATYVSVVNFYRRKVAKGLECMCDRGLTIWILKNVLKIRVSSHSVDFCHS